ncbi:MAG: hypothetical protein WCC04_02915 [Terriglobales bacterium]
MIFDRQAQQPGRTLEKRPRGWAPRFRLAGTDSNGAVALIGRGEREGGIAAQAEADQLPHNGRKARLMFEVGNRQGLLVLPNPAAGRVIDGEDFAESRLLTFFPEVGNDAVLGRVVQSETDDLRSR